MSVDEAIRYDVDTGEVISKTNEQLAAMIDARARRFEEQDKAREILARYTLKVKRTKKGKKGEPDQEIEKIVSFHRLLGCTRYRRSRQESITLCRREDGSTYYAGLQRCSLVWCCPICAAQISQRRRKDLQLALDAWTAQGGEVLMLTLTLPHSKRDGLVGLVDMHADLYKRLWSGAPGIRLKEYLGMIGAVKASEVTHGDHGWHPHTHTLLFVKKGLDLKEAYERIFKRWYNLAFELYEAKPSPHANDLQNGDRAASYIAKYGTTEEEGQRRWGLPAELTRSISKCARTKNGRTQFQMLSDATDGDEEAARLFRDFAVAFYGVRQIRWSEGLRDRLLPKTEELTDEQIVATVAAEDEILGPLDEWWPTILYHKLRSRVLDAARFGGMEAVLNTLENYTRIDVSSSGSGSFRPVTVSYDSSTGRAQILEDGHDFEAPELET